MPAGSLAPPPVRFAALVEGRRKPFALRLAVFLLSLETLVREGGILLLITWWSSSQVSRLSISPVGHLIFLSDDVRSSQQSCGSQRVGWTFHILLWCHRVMRRLFPSDS